MRTELGWKDRLGLNTVGFPGLTHYVLLGPTICHPAKSPCHSFTDKVAQEVVMGFCVARAWDFQSPTETIEVRKQGLGQPCQGQSTIV